MKTGNSILATLGLVFSTAIVGLTPPSAAMNVRESIRVLETVHPDSAVVQTVKVVGRALDVTSTRGGSSKRVRISQTWTKIISFTKVHQPKPGSRSPFLQFTARAKENVLRLLRTGNGTLACC